MTHSLENCTGHHKDDIEKAKKGILKDKTYDKLAIFYKAIGDVTRLKILSLLLISELCVCDIALSINMSQPAISHQMKILKNAGIVKGKRVGKMVYYSIEDEHISAIYAIGHQHIEHFMY